MQNPTQTITQAQVQTTSYVLVFLLLTVNVFSEPKINKNEPNIVIFPIEIQYCHLTVTYMKKNCVFVCVRMSFHLEGCGRFWVHLDHGCYQNHASEILWPLTRSQNRDGTPLQQTQIHTSGCVKRKQPDAVLMLYWAQFSCCLREIKQKKNIQGIKNNRYH